MGQVIVISMLQYLLKNQLYNYYPSNICFRTEYNSYIETMEYKLLLKTIDNFKNKVASVDLELKQNIWLQLFQNTSQLDYYDRSITYIYSFVQGKELFTLSLSLSILMPFYHIEVKKNSVNDFFEPDVIDSMKYEELNIELMIVDLNLFLQNKIGYFAFPENLLNVIVPDVSYQEIPFGKFSLFNAFFNNNC